MIRDPGTYVLDNKEEHMIKSWILAISIISSLFSFMEQCVFLTVAVRHPPAENRATRFKVSHGRNCLTLFHLSNSKCDEFGLTKEEKVYSAPN